MDENTILSLLKSISGNDSLRKKFLDALKGSDQQKDQDPEPFVVIPIHLSPTSGEDQMAANRRQFSNDSLLGANDYQSRGASLEASGFHASEYASDNPLEIGGLQHKEMEGSSSTLFDPTSLILEEQITFKTHQVIIDYLEKHFHVSLHKDVQSAMCKAHPLPRHNEGTKSRWPCPQPLEATLPQVT